MNVIIAVFFEVVVSSFEDGTDISKDTSVTFLEDGGSRFLQIFATSVRN
jgi:hypothetical protein